MWAAAAVPAAMVHLPAPSWAAVIAWYAAPRAGAALGPAPSRGACDGRPPPDRGRAVARALVETGRRAAARVSSSTSGQGDATLIELPDGPASPGRRRTGRRPTLRRRRARDRARSSGTAPCGASTSSRSRTPTRITRAASPPSSVTSRSASSGKTDRGDRPPRRPGRPSSARARRAACSTPGNRLWLGEALVTVLNPDDGVRHRAPTTSPSCSGWTGAASRCSSRATSDGEGEERVRSQGGPLRRHHAQGGSSRQPLLVERALSRRGAPHHRDRLRGRPQPLSPSGAGDPRAPRGGRRPRLPDGPRRRHHRRDRRRPSSG